MEQGGRGSRIGADRASRLPRAESLADDALLQGIEWIRRRGRRSEYPVRRDLAALGRRRGRQLRAGRGALGLQRLIRQTRAGRMATGHGRPWANIGRSPRLLPCCRPDSPVRRFLDRPCPVILRSRPDAAPDSGRRVVSRDGIRAYNGRFEHKALSCRMILRKTRLPRTSPPLSCWSTIRLLSATPSGRCWRRRATSGCISARDRSRPLRRPTRSKPTVILQDLVMPDIDGLTLLAALSAPTPPRARLP